MKVKEEKKEKKTAEQENSTRDLITCLLYTSSGFTDMDYNCKKENNG